MKKYLIKIHSFVDLITNSSTEIFVEATESTIKTIKEVIDNLLKFSGSQHKADDLFEFSLDPQKSYNDMGYKDVHMIVKSKIESPELKSVEKILSDLSGLFSIEGSYNG